MKNVYEDFKKTTHKNLKFFQVFILVNRFTSTIYKQSIFKFICFYSCLHSPINSRLIFRTFFWSLSSCCPLLYNILNSTGLEASYKQLAFRYVHYVIIEIIAVVTNGYKGALKSKKTLLCWTHTT